MQIKKTLWVFVIAGSLSGCTADNVLTKEEIENQNKSSEIVTGVLFNNDLDETASYNIRKDGYVVILFDSSVPENKYTEAVNQLRSSPGIPGVWAEQSGVEVCPLR
jgi:hypothetical protein